MKQAKGSRHRAVKKEKIGIPECLAMMSEIGEIEGVKIKEPDIEKAVEDLYIPPDLDG